MELIENSMRQPDFRGYWELYKNQEQEGSSVASELFGKTIITSQFKLGEVNQIRLRDRIEYIRAIAVSNCTFEQICLKTPDGCSRLPHFFCKVPQEPLL